MCKASDEYWQNHLKQYQPVNEYILRETLKTTAENNVKLSEQKQRILQQILLKCDKNVRDWLSLFLTTDNTYHLLLTLYENLIAQHKSESEALKEFNNQLSNNLSLRKQIDTALDVIEESEAEIKNASIQTLKTASDATILDKTKIQEMTEARSKRTWKDIPKDQLLERMSKGEIIPQDEWIPGISKGGRKLKPNEFEVHMEFTERLHAEANKAYQSGDYSLAYTRYHQGVNTINWVEGETEEMTQKIKDKLLVFYKNLAAAAIHIKEYREAESACTNAISLDEYDSKSLYRRAQVYIILGELTKAKEDIVKILKSPYASTDDIMAARKSLQSIRDIVSSWKSDTRHIIQAATQKEFFSSLRESNEPSVLKEPTKSPPVNRIAASEFEQKTSILSDLPLSTIFQYKPQYTVEKVENVLLELIDHFTTDEVQKKLITMRAEADLEKHRFILRFINHAESLFEGIWDKLEISGNSFDEQKQVIEKEIRSWSYKNKNIKLLFEKLNEVILGDTSD